ncbi:rho GTPase-activating protein 12-like isoform X14 [Takifugu flavidus]|uniref:rho GTPase-activating protein 12-like isoform X14 n=1 Tax=Takifugu flavidus TaxID=433684 RepID=UPI0025442549|nr:rho GTPase-activating protein 12-like isoform X14 [Takifugu flavidus]
MADLPIAPGEVYIEVEYDYEYKAKNRVITIHQGECYMLVKKTNEDWWQVRKEEGSKAFYVPAQYVREVRKALMPPPKPLPHPPAASGNPPPHNASAVKGKPTSLDLGLQNQPAENLHRQESSYRRSPSAQTAATDRFSPPIHRRDSNNHRTPSSPTDHDRALAEGPHPDARGKSSTLPRARARSPELVRAPLDVDSTQGCDSAGEERRTNDSESGDEMSSSSTEQLQTVSSSGQGRSESPVYTNLQELKITQSTLPPAPAGSPLHVLGDWETYKDQNGRHFYYNRSTQERTWKPPRAKDVSTGSSRHDSQSTGESSEWLKHVDEQGRPYYYSADGSRSEWELPKYNHSPPQLSGDAPKTRSLDRRQVEPIVLTKWRHSTFVSEPGDKPSQKCGLLNMTKITEHGKKVRKNWTSSWTVLQGSALLFTKSQGGGTSWFGASQSKPEFTVDLRGGAVEWASKDKSSKKHVLELKTRQGTELLIQSDNDGVINEWFRALQDSISTHAWESDEAIEEDMPESPVEKHDKDKEHRDSKKNRAMKSSTSMDSSDNKKTRHKLKKFLTRRPTLQAVRDKGYIKDQVFGCSLSDLCHRESATVPAFVKMCIDHVENSCLCVDGLYRVSGNLAVIQKLRYAVDHDEKVNLQDGKWEDIHVTTGALKMYFRELPEPLFTYALFHDFVSAIKITDYKHRVQAIKDLVKQLPRPNHDTMQALFKHLRKVIDHGEENRMTTQSVAIVFGPTLLRPETETFNMAVHMVYPNQIVELILHEYENIFGR